MSTKAFACIAFLAVVLTTTAACDKNDNGTASGTATTTTTRSGAITQTSNDPRTTGFVGARIDVTDLACKNEGDHWTVSGKVTNPTAKPVDYRIFTSFLNGAKDTAGLLQTDVRSVAAGKAKEWRGELALDNHDDLECVLRVERTDAGAP